MRKKVKVYKIKNAKLQLIIFFAVMYFAANYLEWFKDESSSMISNLRMAIFGSFLFIAYMGTLLLPEPRIARPHPVVWRMVQGFTFAYCVVICFFVFLVSF
jgi:hypothetical protein